MPTWPSPVSTTGMDADTDGLPRSDILDLTTKFNDVIAMRGVAGGVCDLDGAGKVPSARLATALAAIYGLTPEADKGLHFTGASAASVHTQTAFARSLLDDADAGTARTTLGVVAATELTAGLVELATQAEAEAGTDGAVVMTALKTAQAIAALAPSAFTKSYASTAQTITLGGLLTLAHGLSSAPKIVRTRLECTTADAGYSIGDIVESGPSFQMQNSGGGQSIYADSTNIYVRYSNASYQGHNKSTGAPTNLTTASWKLLVLAWA